MTKLDLLISLQGMKLVWSGFDAESDGYVLLFEDGSALNITEFEPIDDFSSFATNLLSTELTDARQILALDQIVNPPPEEEKEAEGESEEEMSEEAPADEEEKEAEEGSEEVEDGSADN